MSRAAGFEGTALAHLHRRTIDNDRYPLSPRLAPSSAAMKPYRQPPMTLRNAAPPG
jgi:hypothetical protein